MKIIALALGILAWAAAADEKDEEIARLKERLARSDERDRAALREQVDAYLSERAETAPSGDAGYDEGFFLRSADRRWTLRINGQIQLRALYDNQEESLDDAHRWGFEIPRAKLVFSGAAGDPRLTWRLQGNFESDGGGFTLEDAYLAWDSGNGWMIVGGQFKCPVLREEKVDSAYQLCVERSNLNDVLTSGERFGGGVAVSYGRENWRVWGAVTDGDGTANTPALLADTEYAVTFRGEVVLQGSFRQFDDFTSFRGDPKGIMLGVGAHTQKGEYGTSSVESEVLLLSADLSLEFGGANLFGEVVYVHVERGTDPARDILGFVLQGGLFVGSKTEVFARYEFADLDSDEIAPSNLSVLTAGLNHYFRGHKAKATFDLGYAFEVVPAVGPYSGLRVDNPLADGQFLIRLQFQALF